jgi:hypothetical protein
MPPPTGNQRDESGTLRRVIVVVHHLRTTLICRTRNGTNKVAEGALEG